MHIFVHFYGTVMQLNIQTLIIRDKLDELDTKIVSIQCCIMVLHKYDLK